MTSARISRVWGTILLTITIFSLSLPAYAQYSGGMGEPNDPYQIATAEDLMLLGETPEDYDKHFILTANIDLDPNLPGRKVFDKAVIAPCANDMNEWFEGTAFDCTFDGNGYTISYLTITGTSYLGLFGQLASGAEVRNLGLVDVNITGSGDYVGGLVGYDSGNLTRCYSSGVVVGVNEVGGLVGRNGGTVTTCFANSTVKGTTCVGGLTGYNGAFPPCGPGGSIADCYVAGVVVGSEMVGGLVGQNGWRQSESGPEGEGLLSLPSIGSVSNCYSTSRVSGITNVGGLIGDNEIGDIVASFWDIETSGQQNSAGGTGLTTGEMKDIRTYLGAGWDFAWAVEDGLHEIWQMPQGDSYPVLAIFNGYTPPQLQGVGTAQHPYLIHDALELGAMYYYSPDAHYRLVDAVALSGICWGTAVIPRFAGTFDGDGHTISHLTVKGTSYLGLFSHLEPGAQVKNLGVVDVSIVSTGSHVGGLVGANCSGHIKLCWTTGVISGVAEVGGLAGSHRGDVTQCHSAVAVKGSSYRVGGLVGLNAGAVTQSYSTGMVVGDSSVGGLAGSNQLGNVTGCYSTGFVSGDSRVGGLVGWNYEGSVTGCYSGGAVSGDSYTGGLVGSNYQLQANRMYVAVCFWDTQTSGQVISAGGMGKTTAEMQTAATFLEAGWDFVDETANGTDDVWWINEGQDYPRLWWELIHDEPLQNVLE